MKARWTAGAAALVLLAAGCGSGKNVSGVPLPGVTTTSTSVPASSTSVQPPSLTADPGQDKSIPAAPGNAPSTPLYHPSVVGGSASGPNDVAPPAQQPLGPMPTAPATTTTTVPSTGNNPPGPVTCPPVVCG